MRILAIDASTHFVSVALFSQNQLVSELDSRRDDDQSVQMPNGHQTGKSAGESDELAPGFTRKRSKLGGKTSRVFPPGASVLLAPMIDSVMRKADWQFKQIGLIAVATGPGRFTGLRVAVVTAKALAFANKCQIMGVNTLEVIAAQTAIATDSIGKVIRPVLNAQRNQVFSAGYRSARNWQTEEVFKNEILSQKEWIKSLNSDDVVSGAGLKPMIEDIQTTSPGVVIAPNECGESTAIGVGEIAWRQFEAGRRDDLWTLEPFYFRPSSAEELRGRLAQKRT